MSRNYGLSYFSLSFYLIIFYVSGWPIQGSINNTSKINFLVPSCVLEHPAFILQSKPVLVLMESLTSQSVSYLTYSVIGWTHLASPWTHIIQRACMQLCPILCDPINYSPPGSSVHEILQAKILEWVAITFFRESSQSRDQTCISCIAGGFFPTEPLGKPTW